AAVADVLNRMREIVDEAGRDPAEHRLPLLLTNLLLQFNQAIGHGVERVTELADFILPGKRDPLVHATVGDRASDPRQREDALDERSAPDPSEDDRAEQCETNRRKQLDLQLPGEPKRILGGLFDDHRPTWIVDRGADREKFLPGVRVGELCGKWHLRLAGVVGERSLLGRRGLTQCYQRLLIRIAVR